jgi:hypothetical protein
VVSCLSLDYASLFSYVGARTDKHVREHEVYSVGIGTDAARRELETGSLRVAPHSAAPRLIGQLTDARPFGVHRMALLGAPLVFALMVASGVAVRAQVKPEAAPAPVAAVRPAAKPAPVANAEPAPKVPVAAAAPKAAAAKVDTPGAQPQTAEAPQASAPATAPVAKAARPPRTTAPKPVVKPNRTELAAAKPEPVAPPAPAPALAAGVIQLSILPWGEVFVDGKSRGVSPPLRSIELPPGAHTVEVRNTTFPVHSQRVEVRSGEPVRIRHQFR